MGDKLTLEMVLIPAGEFIMGKTSTELDDREDGMPHKVAITKPFYIISRHSRAIRINNGKETEPFKGKKKNPVETVSCFEAVAFCEKMSKQSGKEGLRFMLPTEAQWEYACRSETRTRFYFGNNESDLENYAWYEKMLAPGS